MKVFGTPTSPYVRRVRVIARELGLPYELVDIRTEEGQATLKAHTPIWKVPAALVEGRILFDSRNISDALVAKHGFGPLRPVADDFVPERNFMHVVDGALDAGIRVFYATRDGLSDDVPLVAKERARLRSCVDWLEKNVRGAFCTDEDGFGLAELALVSALDWMRFRDAYDVSACPRLVAFQAAHQERPSLVETRPSET